MSTQEMPQKDTEWEKLSTEEKLSRNLEFWMKKACAAQAEASELRQKLAARPAPPSPARSEAGDAGELLARAEKYLPRIDVYQDDDGSLHARTREEYSRDIFDYEKQNGTFEYLSLAEHADLRAPLVELLREATGWLVTSNLTMALELAAKIDAFLGANGKGSE